MSVLKETNHAGGFLVWEVLRDYTRDTVTIASGAGKLEAGTVLGKLSSGGKYTPLSPGASNGSQTAAGILWASVDATSEDATGVILLRGPAIVNRSEVLFPSTATEAQVTSASTALAALGILLR